MKRCPACNRVETDESLVFCRADGTALVSDASLADESSATRVLPGSQTPNAQAAPTETAQPQGTTSALDRGRKSRPRTVELKEGCATLSAEHFLSGIKQHKIAALILLIVIAAGIAGTSFYLRGRNSQVTIGSIAVLPFVNQNNDPNTDYLSDGIPESIINSLSQLPNLKVMSRNSAFEYKGKSVNVQAVAKELNVQSVLTGRVMQRGDGLSINVELINAQDNSQIWGQQYNRQVSDVFAVQEEIAREISEKLRLKLTSAEQKLAKRPTENLKAFQYYMQGRQYAPRRTREDLLKAVSYYQRAIEEDQGYALAYAGLGDAYANLGVRAYIAPIEAKRKADEAALKALALDENLAEGHAALAQVYTYFAPYDFTLGDGELQRAIELNPNLSLARFIRGLSFLRRRRFDDASYELLKARELDPLAPNIARLIALPYYLKRDYPSALERLRQANEVGPPFTQFWEIGLYIESRAFSEALAELEKEKVKPERKDDPLLISATGMIYAAQGNRTEALQISKQLEDISGSNLSHAVQIAKIYASLNEKEQALTWLERGLAAGAITTTLFKDDPVWDPIRSDARFTDLFKRMGIPE